MDDNTRQVLIALFTVAGGLVTGLSVAWLGFRFAKSSDRQRWSRDDDLRREALDRAARERWRDRRREVCVDVASRAMTMVQMAVTHRPGSHIKPEEYFELVRVGFAGTAELVLISSNLADSGGDLMIAANAVVMVAVNDRKEPLDAHVAAYEAALRAFMEVARADLRG